VRYAIDIAPLGDLADPHAIVRLAVAAEAAGWDGVSTWDSLGVSMGSPAPDPFVALAAVASATTNVRLILSVVALPRHRPHLVAQSAATLDRWSNGRLVLGIGAGGDPGDFELFGEPFEIGGRLARMDEGLELVDAFLRGGTVSHEGPAYVVRDVSAIGPRSVQEPRPPIWFGGMKPAALRRAARWDGWVGFATSDEGDDMVLSPEAFGAMVRRIQDERDTGGRIGEPFEMALFARSGPDERDLVAAYEAAGATWWLESLSPMRGSLDELLAVVEAGPPR
jgi:alkanesulfonate monooxygenase SsuD/methylene tetrahydromethanopterin reductase-like flavin-dependent oxidoreductase (luciferase family)